MPLFDIEEYGCPHCKGTLGYLCRDAYIHTDVWFCATSKCLTHDSNCSKARKRKDRLKLQQLQKEACPFPDLPVRFQGATLAGWESLKEYQNIASKWLYYPEDFLVYTGDTNTGKTFFSCAAFNWLSGRHEKGSIAWIDAKKFKKRVYASIDEKGGYFPILEKYVKEYKIIIFDGLEELSNSEWQKEVVTTFFDMIYENEGKCVVTSALSLQEIGARISPKLSGKLKAGKSKLIDANDYVKRSQRGEQ